MDKDKENYYRCRILDLIDELKNLGYDKDDIKLVTKFNKEDEEYFLSMFDEESEVDK